MEVDLKFAVLGTGFWSQFQIPAWYQVGGVELVAVYNRTVAKAEAIARKFNIPRVYADPEALFKNEQLDFVVIITEVPAHAYMVSLAAQYGVPVICQKPMSTDFASCQRMVRVCEEAGAPFLIHENFHWQAPIRKLKEMLDSGVIGKPFRARIQWASKVDYHNQLYVKTLEHLILTDLGSHLLDLARFLFGESHSLYCQHLHVAADLHGKDVDTISLHYGDLICYCEMSFSTLTELDTYPETFFYIEGSTGTLELAADYWIRLTTEQGTLSRRYPPPHYPSADPCYEVAYASIVPCNADLLNAIQTGKPAETSARDNLKTMQLVFAAYESALSNQVIPIEKEVSMR